MPKDVKPSPFPKGIKGSEMPAYTSILAWVIADWDLTPEAARSYLVELRGPEPTMEKHQWQARVHLALERKASMGKEHWIHDQNAISLFNHVHSELDRREVVDAGRRKILNDVLDLSYPSGPKNIGQYAGSASDLRAEFDVYINNPANDFPPLPGPIQPPPDKPADEDLEKWFPRGEDDKPTPPSTPKVKEPEMSETPHWIKDDKQRTAFWKDANNLCNKHKIGVDENGKIDIKGRRELVHETLGVEHMEEYTDTPDHAREELAVAFDELYPIDDSTPPAQTPTQATQPPKDEPPAEKPDPVKLLWAELLPDFKTLRPDVTDKNQALEMILKVLGYKSMPEAHTEMGSDGVRKWWAEHKGELAKPAEQKQTTPPSNGKSDLPPTDLPKEIELPSQSPNSMTLVPSGLFPSASEWTFMREMASAAIKSGLMPKGIKTPEAALLIIETGREIGIHPALALRKISIINGQPTLAAELMLALVKRSPLLEYISIVGDATQCVVTVRRKGEETYVETFTMAMAKKMMTTEYDDQGNKKTIALADKYNWRQMPETMLKWRAVSAACRTVFPDVTMGIYTSEEMNDNLSFEAPRDYVDAETIINEAA